MGADAETLSRGAWTRTPAATPAPAGGWTVLPTGIHEWTSPCGRVGAQVWANAHDKDWRWTVDSPAQSTQTVGNPAPTREEAQEMALDTARRRIAELGDAPAPAKPDPINHPTHYTASPYEAITVIESVGSGYCRGNALKYLCRAPHKGSEAADLRKAAWYVRRLVTSREDFSVMGRTEAKAVATSWAGDSGVRYDAIRCLLTNRNYLGAGTDDFSADALAAALEAEAERVSK